jgi:hypothetical protein
MSLDSTQAVPQALPCPACAVPTFRLKSYELLYVVYLFVYLICKPETVTACPSCVRRRLLKNSLFNLVTANLASPIVLLWNAALWVASYRGGHSSPVQDALQEPTTADEIDAIAGMTMLGAATGGLIGGVFGAATGLLGGAVGYRLATKHLDEFPAPELTGEGCAALGAIVASLLLTGSYRQARNSMGLFVLGSALWLTVRTVGAETDLMRQLRGSALSWGLIGALVATAGLTRATAARGGMGMYREIQDDRFLILILIPQVIAAVIMRFWVGLWGSPLAGMLGGMGGGAAGGAFVAGLGFGTAAAAGIGAAIGAVLAALGGLAGGRDIAHLVPREH